MLSAHSKTTRQALLRRLQDPADDEAWQEFMAFYWDLIAGWARQFGCSATLTDDVFQETMVSLLRDLERYQEDRGPFRCFLKTIVQRRAFDAFRREQKHAARAAGGGLPAAPWAPVEDQPPPTGRQAGDELDAVWLRSVLGEALRHTYAQLPAVTYKSFCRQVFDGQPPAQVAVELGLPVATIYRHKQQVLKRLQEEFATVLAGLNDRGLRPPAAARQASGKEWAVALEAYLSYQADLRATKVQGEPPAAVVAQLVDARRRLQRHPAPPTPGAWLLLPTPQPRWMPLSDGATLGRDEECTIVLPVVGISGLHARFTLTDTQWRVWDAHSTNGTWVNGQRVTSAWLKSGDQLQLAQHPLLVVLDGTPPAGS